MSIACLGHAELASGVCASLLNPHGATSLGSRSSFRECCREVDVRASRPRGLRRSQRDHAVYVVPNAFSPKEPASRTPGCGDMRSRAAASSASAVGGRPSIASVELPVFGHAFSEWDPRSSKTSPDPATRSRIVRETTYLVGCGLPPLLVAAMWTAIQPTFHRGVRSLRREVPRALARRALRPPNDGPRASHGPRR